MSYLTRITSVKAEVDDTSSLNLEDINWLIRIADSADAWRSRRKMNIDARELALVSASSGIAQSELVNSETVLRNRLDETI